MKIKLLWVVIILSPLSNSFKGSFRDLISLKSSVFNLFFKTHEIKDEIIRKNTIPMPELLNIKKAILSVMLCPILFSSTIARSDDELAKFAAEGNKVGVDAQCFIKKCAFETSQCVNNPTCIKGLSCLARF
jgi:hypothetical protein